MKDMLLLFALLLLCAGTAFLLTVGQMRVNDATYLAWRFPFVTTLGLLWGCGIGLAIVWTATRS